MFAVLKEKDFSTNAGVNESDIEATLNQFNAVKESGLTATTKFGILQDKLNEWIGTGTLTLKDKNGVAITEIKLKTVGADQGYDLAKATQNRADFLGDLVGQEAKYPGVCLPGSKVCTPM